MKSTMRFAICERDGVLTESGFLKNDAIDFTFPYIQHGNRIYNLLTSKYEFEIPIGYIFCDAYMRHAVLLTKNREYRIYSIDDGNFIDLRGDMASIEINKEHKYMKCWNRIGRVLIFSLLLSDVIYTDYVRCNVSDNIIISDNKILKINERHQIIELHKERDDFHNIPQFGYGFLCLRINGLFSVFDENMNAIQLPQKFKTRNKVHVQPSNIGICINHKTALIKDGEVFDVLYDVSKPKNRSVRLSIGKNIIMEVYGAYSNVMRYDAVSKTVYPIIPVICFHTYHTENCVIVSSSNENSWGFYDMNGRRYLEHVYLYDYNKSQNSFLYNENGIVSNLHRFVLYDNDRAIKACETYISESGDMLHPSQ